MHNQIIYTYLHPGDCAKLAPILNMSFAPNYDLGDDRQARKRQQQKIRIRMLVKPPECETMDEKRQEKFQDAVLIAAPINENSDDTSSVLCLITKPEDDTIDVPALQPQKFEQVTFKVDRSGKIMRKYYF